MRALVYDRYGPPENLRLEELPQPCAGAGEVVVRVHAASVNSWDWDALTGSLLGRIDGPLRPARKVLGVDIAGVVTSVGAGVSRFKPGDAVFGDISGDAWGGFADYAKAKAEILAPKPEGLSFIHAASLPQAGVIALQTLRRRPELGPSDTILINGAGGGVGTFAIQMARALGAKVVAVDRAQKQEALIALGADAFIDYEQTNFTAQRNRYDLIIDVISTRTIGDYRNALRDGGNLVVVGGRVPSLLSVGVMGRLAGKRRGQKLELLIHRPSADDNAELARHCLSGTLKPVIDSIYPLEEGAAALSRIGSGMAVGKVIISTGA